MALLSVAKTSLSGQSYKDYSYDAQIDNVGELVVLSDRAAIENALKLWLYSFKGERIRRPTYGGYVTRWIFSPLNEDTAETIDMAIRQGLENDFSPKLSVKYLSVTPDYENDAWIIKLKVTIVRTGEDIYAIENIRRMT